MSSLSQAQEKPLANVSTKSEDSAIASETVEHPSSASANVAEQSASRQDNFIVRSEPTLHASVSPESESSEAGSPLKAVIKSTQSLLGSEAERLSTEKDVLRAAEAQQRELATRRLEVERLKAENDELMRKFKAQEAQALQEKRARIGKDAQLRDAKKRNDVAVRKLIGAWHEGVP